MTCRLAPLLVLPILLTAVQAEDRVAQLASFLADAGIKNPIRMDLQRPVDARLNHMNSAGLDGSGLFTGEVHLVHDASEVPKLSNKLKPGDRLVLGAGEWKDARFTFGGIGTDSAPILIQAEKPGAVRFTGTSEVTFFGSHLVIDGLAFEQVRPAKNGAVVLRLGNGKAKPADHCIVRRVSFKDCGSSAPEDWPKIKMWLMNVIGRDDTVAGCTFEGMKNLGQMIGAADLPPEALQRLHVLNCRFSARPKIDEQNGYEIIQIGWSQEKARPAGGLIEGCTFEHCDGETETVTLKASDIIVRSCTFTGCQGSLVLREADRVLVQGNVFDGQDRPNTGGVRLCGADHVIIGNTFRNLRKPKDYYMWTISMMAASGENSGEDIEGYGRAKNILISGNRFEHNDTCIAAGIYPRPEYPLLPRNIRVQNNVFVGDAEIFGYVAPDPAGVLKQELRESGNQRLP